MSKYIFSIFLSVLLFSSNCFAQKLEAVDVSSLPSFTTGDKITQLANKNNGAALVWALNGSGDASAANQVTANSKLDSVITNTNGADSSASGTITTQNLVPAGVATAGSAVAIATDGRPAVSIQVTGAYTGALSAQVTIDGTNWVTLGKILNVNTSGYSATITSGTQGIFQIETAGFAQARVTGLAAMTGTATISLRASVKMSMLALDAPVEIAASQTIATVTNVATIGTSVTPGTGALNLAKAEDAVAASADALVPTAIVRRDAISTDTSASGDYGTINGNRFGAAYVAGFRTGARTYSASANVTVAASATDIAALFGNATTTVAITKIRITGIQTTTGTVDVLVIARTAANTGGTSGNMSLSRHEQADSANNSTPITYTANPSGLGTAAGTLRRFYLPVASATAGLSGEYTLEFGDNGKPLILSGTAQGVVINLNGSTVTGGIFNISMEWYEF
jgi:hypothetical protein